MISTVILVPDHEDRFGLLNEGPCNYAPPTMWRDPGTGTYEPRAWYVDKSSVDVEAFNRGLTIGKRYERALALYYQGEVVQRGGDVIGYAWEMWMTVEDIITCTLNHRPAGYRVMCLDESGYEIDE